MYPGSERSSSTVHEMSNDQSNFDTSSDSYNSYSDYQRRKRVAESFSVLSDAGTEESDGKRLAFCRENTVAMCAGECVVSFDNLSLLITDIWKIKEGGME